MPNKTLAAGGAILIALGLWFLADWIVPQPAAPTTPEPRLPSTTAPQTTRAAADVPAEAAADRSRVESTGSRFLAAVPHEFEVEIHARTTEDLPGAGVPVLIAPEHHDLNRIDTGGDGVVRLRIRARTETMTLTFTSPRDLSSGHRLRRITLHAGVTGRAVLRVKPRTKGIVGTLRLVASGKGKQQMVFVRHAGGLRTLGSRVPRIHTDADGVSWFCTAAAAAEPKVAPVELPSVVGLRSPTLRGSVLTLFRNAKFEVGNSPSEQPGTERIIKGTIRAGDGQPVDQAQIIVPGHGQTRTAKDGTYTLKIKAADDAVLRFRAGGGDHGLAHRQLHVGRQTEFGLDAVLDRGLEFRGQLLDPDGKPLAEWRIEIQPEDGDPWIDGTTTDAAGRFAIPNVLDRAHHLRAFPPKHVLPTGQSRERRPSGHHVVTVGRPEPLGSLRMRPRDDDGQAIAHTTVRLWDDTTGEGIRLSDAHQAKQVAGGAYRVEIRGPGTAWHQGRFVQITSGQLHDLGEVLLGPSTSLSVAALRKGRLLYWLHESVISRIERADHQHLQIAPGDYLVRSGATCQALTVTPGANELPEALR